MSSTMPQVFLLVDSTLNEITKGSGSSPVEENGKVRVVSVRKEIIGDVRDMVAGFLEDNCMKFTTGSGHNIGRISARRAWIPL